jgi:hypothetical protein
MTAAQFKGELNSSVGGTSYEELVILFNKLVDYATSLEQTAEQESEPPTSV